MSQTFEAVVAVLDRATGPLRHIQAGLAGITSPISRFNARLSNLGENGGLGRIGQAAEDAKGHIRSLGESLGGLAAPLQMIAGIASVGGLIALTKRSAEAGAALYEGSIKTGVAVEQLARLHYAAAQTGSDAGALDKGLERLSRTMGDVMAGRNKEATSTFAHLGIGLRDAAGHARPVAAVFQDLANAVQRFKGNSVAEQEIAKTLGLKGGDELLPLMSEGASGLKKLGDEYDAVHGKFTGEMARDADETTRSWGRLGTAISGLSDSIGLSLGPRLTPALDGLTKFISVHREFAASIVTGGVALAGIATISSGPVLGAIKGLASPFLKLGGAAWKGAGLAVEAIGNFTTALKAGYGVIEAFGLAGIGPLALVLGVAVGLAFVAYEVYEHWDQLKALWDEMPAPLKFLAGALGAVSLALAGIAAKALLAKTGLGGVAGGAAGALGKAGMWAGLYATAAAGGTAAGHGIFSALGPDFFKAHPELSNAISVISGHGSIAQAGASAPIAGALSTPLAPAGGGTQKSEAHLKIDMTGVPKGTKVDMATKGEPDLDMSVGYAMGFN